jgi:hypothetical protein
MVESGARKTLADEQNRLRKRVTQFANLHFIDNITQQASLADLEAPETPVRHCMYPNTDLGGEGASTPAVYPAAMTIPSLVVWPILSPACPNALDATQQVYRLAYEWALAVLGPGSYELASRCTSN